MITHGCDIGNPCLSFPNYIHWANFVCIEFHEQTLQEQAVGVEATTFLKFSTLGNFYMNQSSFTSTWALTDRYCCAAAVARNRCDVSGVGVLSRTDLQQRQANQRGAEVASQEAMRTGRPSRNSRTQYNLIFWLWLSPIFSGCWRLSSPPKTPKTFRTPLTGSSKRPAGSTTEKGSIVCA